MTISHPPPFELPNRVHLIGIGGIGMTALAQYLLARGVEVSGSDLRESSGLADLRKRGAAIAIGHDADNLGHPDLVVITSAAAETNPEVASAHELGIPVVKRAELLGRITAGAKVIAVAGTHGKTTTTAMIAHLLRSAGIEATLFGGGYIRSATGRVEGPSWGDSSDLFVVEADEFDRSFLHLHPTVAIITSIDFDHPDCYADLDDMVTTYSRFASQVSDELVVAGSHQLAIDVARRSGLAVQTYGTGEGYDWSARETRSSSSGSSAGIFRDDANLGRLSLKIPGTHNIANALAALAVVTTIAKVDPQPLLSALSTFRGAARRLEIRGSVEGVQVIDDYAHHPAEIAAAIRALRDDAGRLRIIFQPHTYTRTEALFDDFVQALSEADEILLLDIYAAREDPIAGVTSERLCRALRASGAHAVYCGAAEAAVAYAAETALNGDIIVTMGAGDVGDLASQIVDSLRTRKLPADSPLKRASLGANASRLDEMKTKLNQAGLQRVRLNEAMSRHTSWRIGGPADIFAVADTIDSLQAALSLAREMDIPCLVLGGGSNILVADEGIEGLVLLNRVRSMKIQNDNTQGIVEAGSGVFFARLAMFTAQNGWAGLEWGVAIPGTVGAGVVNNAGAHHGDVERTLVKAEIIDSSGHAMVLNPEKLRFRYRQSVLKATDGEPVTSTESVVTRAWFSIQPDNEKSSLQLIDELMAKRSATQPISEPSAGSTFTNPSDGSAGSLIERAGLKGFSVGGAQVSNKHANFIVNVNQATASQAAELIRHVIEVVYEQFGVELHPEVQVVGRWPERRPLSPRTAAGLA